MPPAYEVLLLNTAVPQIQAAQAGDTYVVPRDIAFSAALTLSAGTANGVPYLNGSKVLTTGSALTFDGTSLGIGVAPSAKLDVSGASGGIVYVRGTGDAYQEIAGGSRTPGTGSLLVGQGNAGEGYLWNRFNSYLAFGLNNAEAMRLTSKAFMVGYTDDSGFSGQYNAAFSGNVGIGTSSPTGGRLHVTQSSGSSIFGTTAGGTGYGGSFENTDGGTTKFFRAAGSGGNGVFSAGVGATTQLLLDTSGNLGLGVTPSAWGSGYRALQVGGSGVDIWTTSAAGGNLYLSNNVYFDGTNRKYVANAVATEYEAGSVGHVWKIAASGTSGNAISFTQALTLDANRNLLLNGTSAGASAVGTLAIFNGTAPTGSVTDGIILYAEDVSSSSELKVRDEAGNVTTLSPHNFSLIPEGPSEDMAWAYYSEKGGKRINVDMLKLARMVEQLTGEKLVYEA